MVGGSFTSPLKLRGKLQGGSPFQNEEDLSHVGSVPAKSVTGSPHTHWCGIISSHCERMTPRSPIICVLKCQCHSVVLIKNFCGEMKYAEYESFYSGCAQLRSSIINTQISRSPDKSFGSHLRSPWRKVGSEGNKSHPLIPFILL